MVSSVTPLPNPVHSLLEAAGLDPQQAARRASRPQIPMAEALACQQIRTIKVKVFVQRQPYHTALLFLNMFDMLNMPLNDKGIKKANKIARELSNVCQKWGPNNSQLDNKLEVACLKAKRKFSDLNTQSWIACAVSNQRAY